jgi:dihydroorotase
VNPPLREEHDVDALRKALADGTIDCIATDHAPHGLLDKDCEFDRASPGMIGLEICLPLMMGLVRDGAFSLSRLLDSLTRAPARIVGLPPPEIRETAEANLILYDPEAEWTIEAAALRSKGKNTPFLGRTVRGKVLATMVTGRVIFESEERHAGSR